MLYALLSYQLPCKKKKKSSIIHEHLCSTFITSHNFTAMAIINFVLLCLLVPPLAQLTRHHRATHTINAGRSLILSVTVTIFNVPLTSIAWAHEGNILTGGEDRVAIDISTVLPAAFGPVISTLQINAVKYGDAGRYTATASYNSHDTTVEFNITIGEQSRILK